MRLQNISCHVNVKSQRTDRLGSVRECLITCYVTFSHKPRSRPFQYFYKSTSYKQQTIHSRIRIYYREVIKLFLFLPFQSSITVFIKQSKTTTELFCQIQRLLLNLFAIYCYFLLLLFGCFLFSCIQRGGEILCVWWCCCII